MHDPSSLAFEIKSLFRREKSKFFPKGYRPTIISIWHEDPLDFAGKCGCRSDDSCGWFTPPMLSADRELWEKRAAYEYTVLFAKQDAVAKGESYARVCYHPETTYDAVYWIWRSIRHEHLKNKWWYRTLWRYSSAPNAAELEYIQNLASNPVDNLQFRFQHEITNAETFWPFYLAVLNAYRRHARPWYKHPRWHFWHWHIQIHPWQKLRRWVFDRCAGCGKRFSWGYSPTGFSWDRAKPRWFRSADDVYHSECAGHRMTLHREPSKGSA